MAKQALIPPALRAACARAGMSPGIRSADFVFLTGVTWAAANGSMPVQDETQFHACFDKIASVVAEVDLALDAIVEMTSYHVGLRRHFDLFQTVRHARLRDPYPAWTAVKVAELRRVGAVVEIRVVAEVHSVER